MVCSEPSSICTVIRGVASRVVPTSGPLDVADGVGDGVGVHRHRLVAATLERRGEEPAGPDVASRPTELDHRGVHQAGPDHGLGGGAGAPDRRLERTAAAGWLGGGGDHAGDLAVHRGPVGQVVRGLLQGAGEPVGAFDGDLDAHAGSSTSASGSAIIAAPPKVMSGSPTQSHSKSDVILAFISSPPTVIGSTTTVPVTVAPAAVFGTNSNGTA